MKKVFFPVMVIFIIIFAVTLSPSYGQQKGSLNPCDLFTKADAEALFKETISEGQAATTSMPAGVSCKYVYKKGGSYGVTLKVSTRDALKQEGIYDSPKDVFSRQKKARMASESTAKKVKVIPGLGDDAFWNGFDLWILKGDYFINIIPSSYLAGTFKNSEAMEKARYDQDLALSQKVATTVLQKIK